MTTYYNYIQDPKLSESYNSKMRSYARSLEKLGITYELAKEHPEQAI